MTRPLVALLTILSLWIVILPWVLKISVPSSVLANNSLSSVKLIDFDGIRVDERGQGDIHATIINTHIDSNGGDGLELDEAGRGSIDTILKHVTFNDNGFQH
jgi:hypothetical protein